MKSSRQKTLQAIELAESLILAKAEKYERLESLTSQRLGKVLVKGKSASHLQGKWQSISEMIFRVYQARDAVSLIKRAIVLLVSRPRGKS